MKHIIRMLSGNFQSRDPFSQVSENATCIWGVAMGVADGPSVSAGSGHAFLRSPGRCAPGSLARYRGRDNERQDAGRKPQCIVATGMAVAIVLCMSWVHIFRIPPGFAVLNNRPIGTTARINSAGTGSAGCTVGSALAPSHLLGKDPFRRGPGDLRQQPVRVFLATYVRSQNSATDSPDPEQRPDGAPGMREPGWHAIIAVPDIACLIAGRWFQAGHQAVSFRPPSGHARHDVRVLAFRGPAAEVPIGSRRGGCVAGEIAERVQRLDAAVLDPGNGRIVRTPRMDPGSRGGPQGDQLREALSGNPALICVLIRANRQGAGVSSPERWCGAYGGTGGQMSSGDRASLPGRSTRYRVIWLVCPQCGTRIRMECLFYDEGDMPLCMNSLHGRMEVQQ